jgi:hypothetical protein
LSHTLYSLLLIFSKAIVWTLWSLGLTTTIARVILRLRVQHRFQAEDYFAIVAFVFLTGLTAVVTTAAPIFEMTRAYLLAAAVNPLTPLPLPLPEFTARTITALKLMFAWVIYLNASFRILTFF